MRIQFASGRSQIPFASGNAVVSSGGGASATYTLYLAIVAENPAGINRLSSIVGPITVNVGQQLTVTFPELEDGEFFESYTLAASSTNTPSSFVQLAKARLRSNNAPITPPITLTLSNDADFALSAIAATTAALPADPVHGCLRQVTSLDGKIYEYDEYSNAEADGINILSATVGAWIWKPGNFSAYVATTTEGGGCDRALDQVTTTPLRAPRYSPNGSTGAERIYWIVNNDDLPIPAGKRIGATVEVNGIPQGHRWDSLLNWRFLGYANISTGALRTTYTDTGEEFADLNIEKGYEAGKTDFLFPDDLLPNEALAFTIYPAFSAAELNNEVANKGVVRFSPQVFSQSGTYVELGALLGSCIPPTDDRGFVVPLAGLSAMALRRSGLVQSGLAGRSFLQIGPTPLLDLQPDQADQLVAINGNGAMYRVDALRSGEALRAILSTIEGIGTSSPWSAALAVNGTQGIRVTCTYPSDGSYATINPAYPDAIAGLSGKAKLNAPFVTIYVQVGGIIKRFTTLALIDGASQTFDLANWNAGETIASVPSAPSPDFGLFEAVSASAAVQGGGNFPAGSLQVAFAFEYDGTAITSISHDSVEGCILSPTATLAQVFERSDYYAEEVLDLDAMRALPLSSVKEMQLRPVRSLSSHYLYDVASMGVDDGSPTSKFVRLNAVPPTQPGRYMRTDSTQWFFTSGVPAPSLGGIGDSAFNLLTSDVYEKTNTTTWTLRGNLKGPSGQNAYSSTTAPFTQPAVNASVVVAVNFSGWMAIGQSVFVEGGGIYQVMGRPTTTSVTLKNLGGFANAAPTNSVVSGAIVSPSGVSASTSATNWDAVVVSASGEIVTSNGFVVVAE